MKYRICFTCSYFFKQGLVQRTPRGRIATEAAYRHLGFPYAQSEEAAQQLKFFEETEEGKQYDEDK